MWPFSWIKTFLPRGLYGRAALILILPVVVVQLVVSSAFIQRHYEEVTEQMSRATALDVNLITTTLAEDGPEAAARLAEALDIEVDFAPMGRVGDHRLFYDFSGIVVLDVLRERIAAVAAIDLAENHRLAILSLAPHGEVPALELRIPRDRVSASNPHQLLVILIFTGLIMTVLAYLFLRNQLRPIRRLAAAADAFGMGRRVEYRPSGATEVRRAGRAFLDMRDRIESQIEQRTMMLSSVSHDLRTPLTRMRLGLSMLEESEEARALTHDVAEMEGLLNTFLDFARGEALDDPEIADAAEIARRAVDDAQRGGGAVRYDGPEGETPVYLRPQAVHRALANLVSNALRYGSTAVVSLRLMENHVVFSVEDDGPGIPAARRDEARRPFFRLDAARNQDRGSGVGLGLAIVDDIAKRHGGTLRLEDSVTLGGLRADLVLPR